MFPPLSCSTENGPGFFSEGTKLSIGVQSIAFGPVCWGETATEFISINNTGQDPLLITDMSIVGGGAENFSLETAEGAPFAGEQYEVEANVDPISFLIKYSPKGIGEIHAELHITTNDPAVDDGEGQGVKVINLTSDGVNQMILITPNPIVFGQVEGGTVSKIDVTVTNTACAPLTFTNMRLRDTMSPDFRVDNGDLTNIQPIPAEPLAPNASYHFKLVYAPEVKGPDQNDLIVSYELNNIVETTALVDANGVDPCLHVTPNSVDFGETLVGQTSNQEITLEGCGRDTVTISAISFSREADSEIFSVATPEPLSDDEPLVLASGSTRTFSVSFSPKADAPYESDIIISSNAYQSELPIPILGVGMTP